MIRLDGWRDHKAGFTKSSKTKGRGERNALVFLKKGGQVELGQGMGFHDMGNSSVLRGGRGIWG